MATTRARRRGHDDGDRRRSGGPALGVVLGLAALLLPAPAATAAVQTCSGGSAGGFACSGIDLLAHLPLTSLGGGDGNDLWGWTDPVTGREYALMGRTSGVSFVDVTDPENPVLIGVLPTQTVSSAWRDVKTYADHAFVVADGASGHGMQVFDLTRLRNVASPPATFAADTVYAGFGSAHNVAVNEATGYAYAVDSGTCSGGLHVVDVRVPTQPVFAGCHGADGTIHDAQCVIYAGPDAEHQGREVCFTATLSGDVMSVVDVTDKGATVTLSRTSYPGAVTPHQGWLTEDHAYLLFGDESDETSFGHPTRTYVFDVTDLDAPVFVGDHTGGLASIDHNLYVRGSHLYEANYTSGLRILEITDPATASLTEVAFFDTRPEDDAALFRGAWSTYPYFASCTVLVSDMQRGLFVLRPSTLCDCGNGVREGTEECDGGDLGGVTCGDLGCTSGTPSCTPSCTLDRSTCSGCAQCDFDGLCESGEDCTGCPSDCVSGTTAGAVCGNGVCETADGEDCLTCAADCAGRQNGNPSRQFCCGSGAGTNPVGCSDSRCTEGGLSCTEAPAEPVDYCCGDLLCEGDETGANCALDCGGDPGCTAGQVGDPCSADGDCCSGSCKGKPGAMTCR